MFENGAYTTIYIPTGYASFKFVIGKIMINQWMDMGYHIFRQKHILDDSSRSVVENFYGTQMVVSYNPQIIHGPFSH